MREILFRGKRNGYADQRDRDWLEGSLLVGDNGEYEICYGTPRVRIIYSVIPQTVGQYTGLLDKNGKRIFEGDICRNTRTDEIVLVKWHGTFAGYIFWNKRKENENLFDFGELFRAYDKFEVIGNVHDNPELLKGD